MAESTLVSDQAVVRADVTAVAVKGEAGEYTFEVTVRSPDNGCAQHADWWEVVTPAGVLVFRRVLSHSHTDEQPFTRAGGPINIRADETVVVRAHVNNTGYGGSAMQGTVSGGVLGDAHVPKFRREPGGP